MDRPSYPYLKIARDFNVDYGDVLNLAASIEEGYVHPKPVLGHEVMLAVKQAVIVELTCRGSVAQAKLLEHTKLDI